MGDHDISRVERLARQICKSLQAGRVVEEVQLHRSIADANRRLQRRREQADPESIRKAVALALSKGWLVEQDGRFSITPAGVEVSKRSRVGRHKVRLTL
jgi:hypothetical protein